MRLTDEQLSMVLTQHEEGRLVRRGSINWWAPWCPERAPVGCLLQTAFNVSLTLPACGISPRLAARFDDNYDPTWTADEFLAHVERWQEEAS